MQAIFEMIKNFNAIKIVFIIGFLFLSIADALEPYSLKYSDFKDENGELISILLIPHSHCGEECCNTHLNKYPSQAQSILKVASRDLEKVGGIHRFDLYVPPPYFWRGTDTTKSLRFYDYRQPLMQSFAKNFLNPSVSDKKSHCLCLNYTHICEKYDYLDYWYGMCYGLQSQRFERMLDKLENLINEAKKSNWRGNYFCGSFYSLDELGREIDDVQKRQENLEANIKSSSEILQKSREEVTKLFYNAYSTCIASHTCMGSLYERGKIAFNHGDAVSCIRDISALITLGHQLSPAMLHQIGQAYSDANQYDQAIKILTESITQDPKNKEVYLDRAVAYFETGQFNKSLQDYIESGLRPTYVDDDNLNYLQVSKGIALGACRGAIDSSIEFFPSLLATFYGLGRGLWAFSENPIGISKELIESSSKCITYMKESASLEFLQENMSALMEYIEKWDEIDDQQKGYAIGYAIVHFGVDMLACSGSVKAIKAFRDLKRANAVLTMDYAACSPQGLQEIIKSSETFAAHRKTYTREKCKKHVGQQGKHDPKAHNFDKSRSPITVPADYLDDLVQDKLGIGIPQRQYEFGQANYRELVDFGETIGIHIDKDTGIRMPTSLGEIHYNKKGEYHIVPADPKRFKK